MTLFSLLLVMALERVTTKSKQFHIATLAEAYFGFLSRKGWLLGGHSSDTHSKKEQAANHYYNADDSSSLGLVSILVMALVPTLIAFLLLNALPSLFVFMINLLVLWVCLGCPVTRSTYKRYLQAAHREDFQACALHSMSFGNEGGALSNVGKQLVLVNYRQYASVIIFFIVLGAPGVIFYSLIKEWVLHQKRQQAALKEQATSTNSSINSTVNSRLNTEQGDIDQNAIINEQSPEVFSEVSPEVSPEVLPTENTSGKGESLLFVLDWLPVRITTFGFLIVGHFSNALSAWFDIIVNPQTSTYDALASVSKAAEDVGDRDSHLNEPLQLVKLVKRNIVFILMLLSLATMVGVVA
ncbi:regulatory signaling modulator protein AmpE [Glaciecola siphonariae]|uniref:Regulatory signaling modulator protein AmpE n=1 Tax=Glaciecola siphonariae TaxID=521012 RepID=A0ABV9LXU0_9ALTE